MNTTELIDDFRKNKRYGSLELEFRAGELTFVRRKETLIPATAYEKNSIAVPRRENGTHNRDHSKDV